MAQRRRNLWLKASDLSCNEFNIKSHHRQNKEAGGLTIIYRDNIQYTQVESGQKQSFEYPAWKIKTKNNHFNILGVYHQPDSSSITQFTEELVEYVTSYTAEHKNIIITGDLKVRVNDVDDNQVEFFNNTMEAIGLQQHVDIYTHKLRNILDLILTNITNSWLVTDTQPGEFLSDHRAVIATLSLKQDKCERKEIKYRKVQVNSSVIIVLS